MFVFEFPPLFNT